MFGFCVWYRVFDISINNIIEILSTKFNTNKHKGHITIGMEMNDKESLELYNAVKDKILFKKVGVLYRTICDNFYTIQQDYVGDSKTYHISLVYRENQEFSLSEIQHVKDLYKLPDEIKNIKIERWLCDSTCCLDWRLLDSKKVIVL